MMILGYSPFDVVKTRRQMVIGQAETTAVAAIVDSSCDHFGLKEFSDKHTSCKGGKSAAGRCAKNVVGIFGHMQQIVEQEGISGLWKGNLTRMVKVAPA